MLIAEDLLLLMLDDESGRLDTTNLDAALGGAMLVELALGGHVEVTAPASRWSTRRVRVADPATASADPLLAGALNTVAEKERRAQDLVTRLGKGLRETLLARLVERGILRAESEKVLGVFPRRRWPAVDSQHEAAVRRDITAALVGTARPDEHTAALIGLLHAADRVPAVVTDSGLSRREVKARAKTIAEGDWAAKAVKDAVQAAQAAMLAAVTASGAVAASS